MQQFLLNPANLKTYYASPFLLKTVLYKGVSNTMRVNDTSEGLYVIIMLRQLKGTINAISSDPLLT